MNASKRSFFNRYNRTNNIFYSNIRPWTFTYDNSDDTRVTNRSDLRNSISDQINRIKTDESNMYKYVNRDMFKIPKSYLNSIVKDVNMGKYPLSLYYTDNFLQYYKPFSSFCEFISYCKFKGVFTSKTLNQLIHEYSCLH